MPQAAACSLNAGAANALLAARSGVAKAAPGAAKPRPAIAQASACEGRYPLGRVVLFMALPFLEGRRLTAAQLPSVGLQLQLGEPLVQGGDERRTPRLFGD